MKLAIVTLILIGVMFTGTEARRSDKFKKMDIAEVSDAIESAIGANLVYALDLQSQCASLDAPKSVVRHVARFLGRAYRLYSKVIDNPINDKQAERRFAKAHRYEVAGYYTFARYLFRNCETEFNEPLIRRLYYFTRQARRSPRRFANYAGRALFDWAERGPGGKAFPTQFITAYDEDDFEGLVTVSLFDAETSWGLNTRVLDKYLNWEVRKVGATEDILIY